MESAHVNKSALRWNNVFLGGFYLGSLRAD
jgi:hypothetical protein